MKGYVTFVPGAAQIFWKPTGGQAPLHRSEAPHDGFEKIADLDLSEGKYVDEIEITDNRFLYYKIGSQLLYINEIPNQYAKEIMRRDKWFLQSKRHSGGTPAYALIKRSFGDHCPDCWDEYSDKPRRSNCPTCFGTGIENPFHEPLKFFGDFRISQGNRAPFRDKISTRGYNHAFWTTNEPLFKPGDLVFFKQSRYRVISGINYSRMGLFITKQFVPLEAVEYHKPVYKIPLPEREADFNDRI